MSTETIAAPKPMASDSVAWEDMPDSNKMQVRALRLRESIDMWGVGTDLEGEGAA